jgi:FMN reductase
VPTSVYASDGEFADGMPADPALLDRIEQASAQLALLLRSRQRPVAARSVKLAASAA